MIVCSVAECDILLMTYNRILLADLKSWQLHHSSSIYALFYSVLNTALHDRMNTEYIVGIHTKWDASHRA